MKTALKVCLVLAFILTCWKIHRVIADGSVVFAPGPIIAATGANYAYPAAPSPLPGGVLVGDGVNQFRWSNGVIASTSATTVLQFPSLPLGTSLQIQALSAATTGQLVGCTNCSGLNGSNGVVQLPFLLCFSTGGFTGTTAINQFVQVSTATAGYTMCK